MTCKRCGATITIDATELGAKPVIAPAPPAPAHPVGLPHPAPHAGGSHVSGAHSFGPLNAGGSPNGTRELSAETPWNIAQPSGKRERLTTAALLDRYASNAVEPGSLVWRDGMDNWLPPYDVPELAQALAARGLHVPGAALFGSDADEATRAFDTRSLGSASLDLGVPGWRDKLGVGGPAAGAPASNKLGVGAPASNKLGPSAPTANKLGAAQVGVGLPSGDAAARYNKACCHDSTRSLGEEEANLLKRQTLPTPPGALKGEDVTRAFDSNEYALGVDAKNWRAALGRPTPTGPTAGGTKPAGSALGAKPAMPAPFAEAARGGLPVRRDSDATRVFDSRSALGTSGNEDATTMFDARAALGAAGNEDATTMFDARAALDASGNEDATTMFDARSALEAAAAAEDGGAKFSPRAAASTANKAVPKFGARSAVEAPASKPLPKFGQRNAVEVPASKPLPKFGPQNELEAASQEDATRMFDARRALEAAAEDDSTDTFDAQSAMDAAAEDEATRMYVASTPGADDPRRMFRGTPQATPPLDTVRVPPPASSAQRPPAPGAVPTPPPSSSPFASSAPAKGGVPRPSSQAAPPPPSSPRSSTAPRPSSPVASAPPVAPQPTPQEATPYAWTPPQHSAPAPAPHSSAPPAPEAAPAPDASASPVPPPSAPPEPQQDGTALPELAQESSTQQVTAMRTAMRPKRRVLPWLVAALVLGAAGAAVFVLGPKSPLAEKWGLAGKWPLGSAAAPENTGPEFDSTAAGAVLAEAATTASRCKVPDGPTGPGRVHVKYQPSGRAESAKVSDPYAGTVVGECLVNVFENTRVPTFGGKPVIVGKNFEIQ